MIHQAKYSSIPVGWRWIPASPLAPPPSGSGTAAQCAAQAEAQALITVDPGLWDGLPLPRSGCLSLLSQKSHALLSTTYRHLGTRMPRRLAPCGVDSRPEDPRARYRYAPGRGQHNNMQHVIHPPEAGSTELSAALLLDRSKGDRGQSFRLSGFCNQYCHVAYY